MVDCMSSCSESFKKGSQSNLDSLMDDEVSPTHLLSLAIRKRREIFDQKKEPDLCRELLNKALIQHLCTQLGEGRSKKARRYHRSRSASKRRRSRSQDDENLEAKRPCIEDEDESKLQIDDYKGEDYNNQGQFYYTDSTISMVQAAPDNLDYTQMEKFLDSNEKDSQLDGYVGHWSPPSTSTDWNDKAAPQNPEPSNDSDIPDDPLEMNALFSQLYRQSYSIIISPSKG